MIKVIDLTVQAGTFRISDVHFTIPAGQYGVLMGKTGCGKTTILEAVCGLKRPEKGRILLNNQDVTNLRPADRGIGLVPQEGSLNL